MTVLVALLGASIAMLGLGGAVSPDRFRLSFTRLPANTRYVLAVVVRIFMGGLLWWLAEDLRHPSVMRVLAAIAIVAAVFVLLLGPRRLDRLVDWWLARPDGLMRVSMLCASAFGAYLVFVAL
jgi:hypothetical protein